VLYREERVVFSNEEAAEICFIFRRERLGTKLRARGDIRVRSECGGDTGTLIVLDRPDFLFLLNPP